MHLSVLINFKTASTSPVVTLHSTSILSTVGVKLVTPFSYSALQPPNMPVLRGSKIKSKAGILQIKSL